MSERQPIETVPTHEPVTTMADLLTLDGDEITEGYRDGRSGEPEPGGNRSRAYWHGWRCGACDAGRIQKDIAMVLLIRDCAPVGRFKPELQARIRG